MKLFCKHDYRLITAKKRNPITLEDGVFSYKGKVGVTIYCTKCGKQKKGLARKIAYFIAKEETEKMQEQFANEITRIYIEEATNEQNTITTKNS